MLSSLTGSAVLAGARAAAGGPALFAANPLAGALSLGSQLLGGGLFGSSKSSSVSGYATGYSGVGNVSFSGDTNFPGKPLLDLENPLHILALGGLLIAGIYAYKNMKKG